MYKKYLVILLVTTVALGACAQKSFNYQKLEAEKFKDSISAQQVQLVDVRTPDEFAEQHIEYAINIDFFEEETFIAAFKKLDKNKPIYLYCRSGNRSSKSAMKIAALGFNVVYDLDGGILAWNKTFNE